MKKILFCINTLSRAGAETALLELLGRMEAADCEIDLYVMTGMGELAECLPAYVSLLNQVYSRESVLGKAGRRMLAGRVIHAFLRRGSGLRLIPYLVGNALRMCKSGGIRWDKLGFRILAEGGEGNLKEYDLAVAFLEGAATYYVADHIKAKRKLAFVHVDYSAAGYTRELDRDCYQAFDQIYAVSEEVKESFLTMYPEHASRLGIFENLFSGEKVRKQAEQGEGFSDAYAGRRILTVARLVPQKAVEVSVEAAALCKAAGLDFRWYVLGEGVSRTKLEKLIAERELQQEFLLLGQAENPYPYMRQATICVQASAFEGKSIAVREEMALGCVVLVSDTNGNRELIRDGENGLVCDFTAQAICEKIKYLFTDGELRKRLGQAAEATRIPDADWKTLLFG